MNLSQTVRLLGNILGQVLVEQESNEIFTIEEDIRDLSKMRRLGNPQVTEQLSQKIDALSAEQTRAVASAFALYFDLVNLAEENDRIVDFNAKRKASGSPPDSIRGAVEAFKTHKVPAEKIQAMLDSLAIELVFTAHPTQAKRRSLMSKLVRISGLLKSLTEKELQHSQVDDLVDDLYAEISTYWLTERARTAKPQVTDEVRTGLYFIDEVLWDVLPLIYQELEDVLAEHYPEATVPKKWLSLASWIGVTGMEIPMSPIWSQPRPCACTAAWPSRNTVNPSRTWLENLPSPSVYSQLPLPLPIGSRAANHIPNM